MTIKGGGLTPYGKKHLKFPFWLFEYLPYAYTTWRNVWWRILSSIDHFFLFWCYPSNKLHQFRLHSLSKNILPKSVLPPILCCPEAHSCVKWYASHQGSSPHNIPITTIYVETELGHKFAQPIMLCQDHETLPNVPDWHCQYDALQQAGSGVLVLNGAMWLGKSRAKPS